MKRIVPSLLLILALILSLSVCAHAEARIDYVSDYAGILDPDEQKDLPGRVLHAEGVEDQPSRT